MTVPVLHYERLGTRGLNPQSEPWQSVIQKEDIAPTLGWCGVDQPLRQLDHGERPGKQIAGIGDNCRSYPCVDLEA
jgi:hypothetical protein